MKYVRTKDGIFDKIEESLMLASNPPQYELTKNGKHIRYEFCSNCQLADTIEELCDEFVGIIEGERFVFSNTKENELFVKEQNKYHAYKVLYGAIWTDKGLIYVAKMNKKGELELL